MPRRCYDSATAVADWMNGLRRGAGGGGGGSNKEQRERERAAEAKMKVPPKGES